MNHNDHSSVRKGAPERLRALVEAFAEPRCPRVNPRGHAAVKQRIIEQLEKIGPVRVEAFRHQGSFHENIVLDLPASNPLANDIVIVGAHYDSVPHSPGADDNASAVAVLIEMARALGPQQRRHHLRFVAFDLEEVGFAGSRHHASQCVAKKENIKMMLSLEMLGYCAKFHNSQSYPGKWGALLPSRGDFIGLLANLKGCQALVPLWRGLKTSGARCVALPVGSKGEWLEASRRSDQVPFWDNGFPAAMVTDTANLRNPHYHEPTDTPDTLDYEFMANVALGLTLGVAGLIGSDPRV